MSNPQDAPLPNPEDPSLADNKKHKNPKNSSMKRFFKNLSIGRFFARKKANTRVGNQMDQGQSAVTEPEEMHEMQELQNQNHSTNSTEWVQQQHHYHIEKPLPQPQPQAAS